MNRFLSSVSNALFGCPIPKVPALLPGMAAAGLLAWASTHLARVLGEAVLGFERSPVSSVMVAVLLGMAIGNAPIRMQSLLPGCAFAVKKLLRLGIVLLGLRLSLAEVFRAGAAGLPVVVVCMAGGFLLTRLIAGRLGIAPRLGTLIAAGTSICGVSAIAAAGPAIGAREEEISYAVAVITLFGIIATLVHPYVAHVLFGGAPEPIGIFLGTAVHDTSQVSGAAMVYQQVYGSSEVLDTAMVTKLVRNLFLIAILPVVSLLHAQDAPRGSEKKKTTLATLIPLFVLGFVVCSLIRSVGDTGIESAGRAFGLWEAAAWQELYTSLAQWGQHFIVAALAGVGLTTRFSILMGLGIRPLIVGLTAAVMVGMLSAAVILW